MHSGQQCYIVGLGTLIISKRFWKAAYFVFCAKVER